MGPAPRRQISRDFWLDLRRVDTHVSVAKTLGVALGIDAPLLDADFTDNGSIKYVKAAIA
jgi:hypothetical protein